MIKVRQLLMLIDAQITNLNKIVMLQGARVNTKTTKRMIPSPFDITDSKTMDRQSLNTEQDGDMFHRKKERSN